MAIAFPLTLPSRASQKQSSVLWIENNGVVVKENPYSGIQQVQNWGNERWEIEVSIDPMTREDAQEWWAALSSVGGQRGTFYFGDEVLKNPLGAGSGSPKVKDANQKGYELTTYGWTAGANVLKKGDMFSVNDKPYRCETDVIADGAGEATINIWPHARKPAVDSALVLSGWRGVFRLAMNRTPVVDNGRSGLFPISFTAIEVLP